MRKVPIMHIIMLVFFLLYQAWAFILLYQHPIIGINLRKSIDNQWVVAQIDSASIVTKSDIRLGDIVVAINETNPNNYWAVKKWGTADQAHSIRIDRDGQAFEVIVNNQSSPAAYDIIALLAELFSLFVAGIIYRKAGKSGSSLYLSAVFLDIAFIFLSLATSARGDPTGRFMIGVFMLLLPAIFLQFFCVFLKERVSIKIPFFSLKRYRQIVAVFVVLQLSYFIDHPASLPLNQSIRMIGLIASVLGILIDLGVLLYFYVKFRQENNAVATMIKTVFWSLFFSVSPIVFFSFVPQIIFGHEWVTSLHMSWFLFLFPLTFAYLLTTRRLYDVDMIMRRILFTIVVAAAPALFLTTMLRFIFPTDASTERLVLSFWLLLSTGTLMLYSVENITTKLMPVMFPRKYRLQMALTKLSTGLGSISSFQEMKDMILADLVETLEVTGGAIVFWYGNGPEVILEGDIAQQEVEELIRSGEWRNPTDYTCFEVSRQEEYTSYLIMGKKRSGTVLGLEEIQWMGLIIHYLAVALENVHLIRKLNRKLQQIASLLPEKDVAMELGWFRKLMFDLKEEERLRLASDLHDTTMQDLFFLKGKLRSLMDKYTYTKEDNTTLSGLMDYIDIINMNLRQSCFELHPYLLKEIGLVPTLHKLIHSEQAVCPFEIELFTSEVGPIEQQDMELKRHLFRMVQELLNNAKKHSEASKLRLSLYTHRDALCLQYEDNGVGFDPNRQMAQGQFRTSGMGLEQLKSRILSLGGNYELDTGIGRGMKLFVRLPKDRPEVCIQPNNVIPFTK